jgi:hypothetical protein
MGVNKVAFIEKLRQLSYAPNVYLSHRQTLLPRLSRAGDILGG